MDTNQKENDFIIQNGKLSPAALKRKTELENNPASRTDHMAYLPDMEQISSDIRDKVLAAMNAYEPDKYTARNVLAALSHDRCSIEDFKALLSPAAEPFLEKMAQRAERETRNHFGNSTYIFTPLYIANYCENYCVYCGFNCYNDIHRKQLSMEEIEHEMKVIADSGIEEILMLTGESKSKSSITYIGDACRLAKKYFRNVGLEIYPCNTKDYAYLHECGADYVTVFQETYNADKYETLHLMGHKRVFPYRFEAQERALMGGMRGVGFSALLGLSDFRKDALATALHVYYLQRKYPHAEMSLSCPRLRPIINNEKLIRWMYMKNSSVRFYVHTAFFCHMPELPYHQGNRLLSETVLSRLPAPRYLPVSAPVSAIMKPNMKAVKKKTAVTSNLKLPTPAA